MAELMLEFNAWTYEVLNQIFGLVGYLGVPIAVLAWLTVFCGSIGMGVLISRQNLKGKWLTPIIVGLIALTAHMLDCYITLIVTPDLALEANPIWKIIVDSFGMTVSIIYGFTGKLMLGILSFEFYAYYLGQRDKLFPTISGYGFGQFCKSFGSNTRQFENITNFFSFVFSLTGPFMFYVIFLNILPGEIIYMFPPFPVAIIIYLSLITFLYFYLNYFIYKKR